MVVVEDIHNVDARDGEGEPPPYTTKIADKFDMVVASAAEVTNIVAFADEDTHCDEVRDCEGNYYWNYDNDDEELDVDDVNEKNGR